MVRGIGPAVLLCLFAAVVRAAEIEDWSDAPAAWTTGLDLSAFCEAGAWTFDSRGEFVIVSERPPAPPAHMRSDDTFFSGYYRSPVHWSLEGPVFEELTTFRIYRGAERGLTMEGFLRDELAVTRRFDVVKPMGWFQVRKVDAATCKSGEAPLIEIHNSQVGCCGGTEVVKRVRLAAAADGALIVRIDDYSRWLIFPKDHERRYARFAAVQTAEPDAASPADEVIQAPDR
jgi:hypothetical protein